MYKRIIRPLFFCFDAEKIHHFVFAIKKFVHFIPGISKLTRAFYKVHDDRLKRTVFGLEFDNPVGLAAGFDKDAKLFNELANFGFGFIEIGTLTPVAQSGNLKPRLFRLKEDSALINRMGFNNDGVQSAVERLKNAILRYSSEVILVRINIHLMSMQRMIILKHFMLCTIMWIILW